MKWSMFQKVMYCIYIIVARDLPSSRHSKIAKNIRLLFAKKILKNCADTANIEHGCSFGPNVSVGEHSSIGVHAECNGTVVIGDNVMMAPEVCIYSGAPVRRK